MATSGTTAFSLELVEAIDEAFERAGVDPSTITARHLRSARRSANLLMVEWANRGVHLWAVEEVTLPLVASDKDYTLATDTIALLEVIVRRDGVDTPVLPLTRDQYAMLPDKDSEGLPTNYYLDRQTPAPILYLWDVPENSTDELHYWRMRQLEDFNTGANTADLPYRWLEAFTAGLAKKLAEKYSPDREMALSNKATARFNEANQEDRERAPTTIRVQYRRR